MAKIIGVGNGDPSSHEPDKCADGAWPGSESGPCKELLFNGKCQVIIQAGTKPDLIKFEAKAAGLWTGSTDIHTVSPAAFATITWHLPLNKALCHGPDSDPGQAPSAHLSGS